MCRRRSGGRCSSRAARAEARLSGARAELGDVGHAVGREPRRAPCRARPPPALPPEQVGPLGDRCARPGLAGVTEHAGGAAARPLLSTSHCAQAMVSSRCWAWWPASRPVFESRPHRAAARVGYREVNTPPASTGEPSGPGRRVPRGCRSSRGRRGWSGSRPFSATPLRWMTTAAPTRRRGSAPSPRWRRDAVGRVVMAPGGRRSSCAPRRRRPPGRSGAHGSSSAPSDQAREAQVGGAREAFALAEPEGTFHRQLHLGDPGAVGMCACTGASISRRRGARM